MRLIRHWRYVTPMGWDEGGGGGVWEWWEWGLMMGVQAHWSTETGLISDTWVGACGSIASVIGFRDAWRATA